MRRGEREVSAVVAFALVVVGKTDEANDRAVEILRLVDRLGIKFFVMTVALQRIALCVVEFLAFCCETICERHEFVRVDATASRALIAAVFCQRAYDENVFVFVRREQIVVVLEKYYAFFGNASRKIVRRFVICLITVFARVLASVKQFEYAHDDFVERGFVESTFFDCFDDLLIVHAAARGHFEIHTRAYAFDAVVGRVPVADYETVEAPFFAQNAVEQSDVVRGVYAVDLVVRSHHGVRLFFDAGFEGGQIYLSESTLVDDTAYRHSEILVVVGAEMLERSAHAVLLYAVDISRSESACKIGVFRKIFEISAAKR